MKYRVEVVQTNVFYIEADSPEHAKAVATSAPAHLYDYIWDEDQSSPDSYGVHFNIQLESSSWASITEEHRT